MNNKDNLKYLIEDYVDIRLELFYFTLNNRLTDIIDTKEYKELQSKKKKIKEEINFIIDNMGKEYYHKLDI